MLQLVAVEAEVIEDAWTERSPGSDAWRDDDERAAEVADDAQVSLQDHLVAQLEYANLAPRDLAIARAIAHAHRGSLTASSPGGACFELRLPIP